MNTDENNIAKADFRQNPLRKGDYENCIFTNCNFSGSDLSDVFFLECEFRDCDLSMVKLNKTTLRDVAFKDCKMLGIQFEACSQFGFSIKMEGCILSHSSFYQAKLKKTIFKKCTLQETDFTGCDLSSAVFDNCDLGGATFDNTILERADLTTSVGYNIDPEANRIRGAKFALTGLPGLLTRYDIEIDTTI